MVCSWKHVILALILTLLLLPSTAWAQTDPEGRALAEAIYEAMELGENQAALELFSADQALAARAYLSAIEYAFENLNNPEEVSEAGIFARTLAEQIKMTWGDPTPLQISDYLVAEDPRVGELFAQYAASYYPAYANSQVLAFLRGPSPSTPAAGTGGPTTPDMSQALSKATERFYIKSIRLLLAVSFSDLDLSLQELDTLEVLVQELVSVAEAEGLGDQLGGMTEVKNMMAVVKLGIMVELGLLNEFDAQIGPALARLEDQHLKFESYLRGFRIALRQGETTLAAKYLQSAESLARSPSEPISPIHLFSLSTARFQLNVAQGQQVDDQAVLSAFNQAWDELSTYRPEQDLKPGIAWTTGRFFASYWIRELAKSGTVGEAGTLRIMDSATKWGSVMAQGDEIPGMEEAGDDAPLVFRGFLGLAVTTMDLALEAMERNPKHLADIDVGEATSFSPEQLEKDFAGLDIGGPNFGPYKLTEGPYFKTLSFRNSYIRAIDPKLDKPTRISRLQALQSQMGALDNETYINSNLNVGKAFAELGRSDLATPAWERAFERAEQFGFVQAAVEAASLLAEQFGKQENWTQASVYAAKANQSQQEDLTTSDQEGSKGSVLSSLTIKAHIKSNNPEKALEALSQGQQMSTASAQLSGNKEARQATKLLANKKKQVATLTQNVQHLKTLPASPARDELLNKAEKVLAQNKSEFLLQSRNIRQKFAKLYTTALRFDPLNLPDIQKALPADAAVVQYFATGEELYIFVVTSTQFRLRSVAVKKSELDSTILAYLKRMQRPKSGDVELDKLSNKLYGSLIAPIKTDLGSSSTLILIPSGKLNVLPFGALQDEQGEPLLASKTIVELAKATDFMTLAGKQPKKISKIVAFANATLDLPAAEAEGEAIKKVYPDSQLFTGGQASKANLMQFGSKAEVLHFATHGTWDPSHALNNHLMLSNNEKLAQEEIFNLDLGETSIVTLSACSTALADTKDLEFVASLAEAFWIAGSNSVVASLWQVDDNSTGLLMTSFYKHLKAGSGRGEALRKAQLEVRKNPKFSHPYFWSGFLLFGDYR